MCPFVVPDLLGRSVAADGSPDRTAWLTALPGVVADLARRWSLTLGAPFEPGGQVSWVAPARDADGRDLVLKVGWRHPEGEHEAAGLRAWTGRGAVEVHDALVEGTTSALLLERVRPGTALEELLPRPEQDVIVAGLLRALWHEPPPGHPFRPLAEMCDMWAAEFDRARAAGPGALDPGIARAGIALYRSLPRDPGPRLLLATDLHAGNVLDTPRGWRLIDPKPYVADPCYDVQQHMLNDDERLVGDPRGFAARMADLAGLDAERVTLWLFARCVQESLVDMPWLRPVATALAPR